MSINDKHSDVELFLTRNIKKSGMQIKASCKKTVDGFVVLKGSTISPEDDYTVSSGIRKCRETACIDENYILQEDVFFESPSGAAMFVVGKSSNGWSSWKTVDGRPLRDLIHEGE